MRIPTVLLLACLVAPWPGMAAPVESGPVAAAVVQAAPATVLEHRLEVNLEQGRKIRQTQRWIVRIDDPAACEAGILAPPGLDGAQAQGAQIFENLLVVPPNLAPGTVLRLEKTQPRTTLSGEFLSAPDLPIDKASVVIKNSGGGPLHVWADEDAVPGFQRGASTATFEWTSVPAGRSAQVVWSAHKDWDEVAKAFEPPIWTRIIDRKELGHELGTDLTSINLPVLVQRAFQAVKLEGGPAMGWEGTRNLKGVLRERSGSAAERGLVLLSLLKAAGFEAHPALYRAVSERGEMPLLVPAPHLLSHPVVAVRQKGVWAYVDPSTDAVPAPELPAVLQTATVWMPGSLPTRIERAGVLEGQIFVATSGAIGPDGSLTWSANLQATGSAREALRSLLAPLGPDARSDAFKKLVLTSQPSLERFNYTGSGLEDPYRPLQIQVAGFTKGALSPIGGGLQGDIAPALAPGLAAWLPPRILIQETASIQPPATAGILSTRPPEVSARPEALLGRSARREGDKVVLSWVAERTYRSSTPTIEQVSRQFFADEGRKGTGMVLLAPASSLSASMKAAGTLTPAQATVLEALAWWQASQPQKAETTIKKAIKKVGFAPLVAELDRYAPDLDPTPWLAMDRWTTQASERLLLAQGLARHGVPEEAWKRAARLVKSTQDPAILKDAVLLWERYQPEVRPDPALDREAAAEWTDPVLLLDKAKAAGASTPVALRQAQRLIEAGRHAEAEQVLAPVLAGEATATDRALARVLDALAASKSKRSVRAIREGVHQALTEAPFDATIAWYAARAAAAVGERDEALEYALMAARLDNENPVRWLEVADRAIAVADLGTAMFATRRASDLGPADTVVGARLALMGTLAHDKEVAQLGHQRARTQLPGDWPLPVEKLMELAPPEALLAVLGWHDEAVTQSAMLLGLRAQLRIDSGRLDAGARDGALLAARYATPEGTALAFAGTVGRIWSPPLEAALDAAASKHLTSRQARMEHRLVSGGDAISDAKALAADLPQAETLLKLNSAPADVAKSAAGWPEGLVDGKSKAPAGYKDNALLGKISGIQAWSHPDRETAVLRVNGTPGLLPPPLSLLYSPSDRPLNEGPGGSLLVQLTGGVMPLYAARAIQGTQEVWGLGRTEVAAERALQDGLTAP